MGLFDNIKNQEIITEFINKSIDNLLLGEEKEESVKKLTKDTIDIKSDVDSIRKSLKKDLDKTYKRVEVDFEHKVTLDLPKYGSKKFERELNGRMHLNVVGVNESSGYMVLRIKGWPDTFTMKLTIKTLDTFKKQEGKAFLIYESGDKYSEGDKKDVMFEIKKLIK